MHGARLAAALLLACSCAPRPAFRQAEPSDLDAAVGPLDVALPPYIPGPSPPDAAPPPPTPRPDAARPDAAIDPPPPPPPKVALLVVGDTRLPSDDAKLKARLEAMGLMVKLAGDSQPATQATGVDLVVVSGTSVGMMVAGKYQAVTVPVVCLEPAIMGAMKMTGTGMNGSGVAMTTQIAIALPMHPLAAGLSGTVAVTTAAVEVSWGAPPATAEHIATLVGMTGRSTIYSYEKGAMMVGGTPAPARRVGLFIHTTVSDRLTPEGWKLFDAAVDWALTPPP
jgi:hypothetical protein